MKTVKISIVGIFSDILSKVKISLTVQIIKMMKEGKKMKLSKLENMFSLSCNVVVYVPSTYNVDKKIDNKKQVESVASLLADYFGGSTSEKCKGYYKANSGKMISEDIIKVYAFCDTESLTNNIDNLIAICENLKTEMKQESIALEINNKMYFI